MDEEVLGMPKQRLYDILVQFDWNWYLAGDFLDIEPNILKETCSTWLETKHTEHTASFDAGHISPGDISQIQDFVQTYLGDSLPLLFHEPITPEKKKKVATSILLEMGLPWRLTHAQEFHDAYAALEEEAISLERWREQVQYLTVVEEALFKVSVEQAQLHALPTAPPPKIEIKKEPQ